MIKILVVDDAAFMRMRFVKLLTNNGFDVVEAVDGNQALEKYTCTKPDVVLLDITMPNLDGLTTLKELLKINSNVRVAMVSAMGQQSMVSEALKLGARDFIVKPFDANNIISKIRKMIE